MPYFYTEDREVTRKFLDDLNERTTFTSLDTNYVEQLKATMNYSPLIRKRQLNLIQLNWGDFDERPAPPVIIGLDDYFPEMITAYRYNFEQPLPYNTYPVEKSPRYITEAYDFVFIEYTEQQPMLNKPDIRLFINKELSGYQGEKLFSTEPIPSSNYPNFIRVISNNEGNMGFFVNFKELRKLGKSDKLAIAIQDTRNTNNERHYKLKAFLGSFIDYPYSDYAIQSLLSTHHERYGEATEISFNEIGSSTWAVRQLDLVSNFREVHLMPEVVYHTQLENLYSSLNLGA